MTRRERSILLVAMVTQGVAVGVTVGIFTLFVEPLEQAFSAPRSQVSLGNSLIVLALSLAGTTVGSFFDRGWARRVMLCGGALMGSALLIAATASQLWMLGVAALLAGIAVPTLGPLAGMSLVTRAIAEDRGRAMGIVSMGSPLGSGFFAGVAGWAIPHWGWRGAFGLLAGLTFAIVLPLVWRWIPARLEGADPGDEPTAPPELGAIARLPVFWLTAIVFALVAGIATGWTSQLAPFLAGAGLGEREVAGLIALQFWVGIPGSLLFGALADRISLTSLFLAVLAFQGFGYACYAVGVPVGWLSVLAVSFGFMGGGMIPLFSLLLAHRVGTQALGRSIGLANLLLLPCTVGAITLASVVYDRTGGYRAALLLFVLGMGVAVSSLLLSDRLARRQALRQARSVGHEQAGSV